MTCVSNKYSILAIVEDADVLSGEAIYILQCKCAADGCGSLGGQLLWVAVVAGGQAGRCGARCGDHDHAAHRLRRRTRRLLLLILRDALPLTGCKNTAIYP